MSRVRRLALAAALVAAVAVVVSLLRGDEPPDPVPRAPLAVGVVANTQDLDDRPRGRFQDRAAAAGAGWLREEILWSEVEPRRGTWRWGRYDRTVADAARRGLRVLALLSSAPPWAADAPNVLPRRDQDFARFAARAARRYGPDGRFWRENPSLPRLPITVYELWNEPYLVDFSADGVDPQRYAGLALAAARAGREAAPGTRWLVAADLSDGPDRIDWLGGLYRRAGRLRGAFDGVAVHPYSTQPPSTPSGTRAQDRTRTRRVERIHAELVRRGDGDLPLWLTEIGWSTCAASPDCVDEDQQARYVEELFALVRGPWRSFVAGVFLYRLQDWQADPPPDDVQERFGVLRADGSPKPAHAALRRVAAMAGRRP